ncbi:hypothetical protein SAMN04487785_11561 [Dyella jiangningensis]|uniref:hypothetical protein n=1 Tax=Dyella sp. AtDHG13 TaxID=1938897 RepID=UPI00088E3330|nr:hypothetical protein [Dyella sp. AtDHG13]PXV58578.1 hypothetical protein BDW41_10587 [Dyella sp. AtDHG13]SDL14757.1 hypothetical protein SAMN04487785_11561 [Dyella jiangningensis]
MMFRRPYRPALLALVAGGVILAGCSSKPETRPTTTSHSASTTAGSRATTGASSSTTTTRQRTGTVTTSGGKPLPSSTGIPACDDYLASYVSCHAAAGVYPPDQIQARYEDMRTSLLQDSVDPNARPQLGARCTALAKQLRATLQGKSCAPVSPAASSSAH